MANEGTKQQIRDWLEEAVRKAKNPDPRERIKRERAKRKTKVLESYAL